MHEQESPGVPHGYERATGDDSTDCIRDLQTMANKGIENLVRFTKENAAEMGARGGKASGRTRRFAKSFKEAAEAEMKVTAETRSGEKINGREAIVKSLVREATKGNVRAAELLLKILEEFPADKHEVTGAEGKPLVPGNNIDLNRLTDEQRAALLSIGEQALNDTSH